MPAYKLIINGMKTGLFFYGIKTVVESDDAAFLSTADNSLCFFKQEDEKNPKLINDQELHVSFFRNQEEDLTRVVKGCSQIGYNAYLEGNRYVYTENDLVIQVEKKDNTLHVLAQTLKRKDIRGLIRKNLLGHNIDYFLLVRKLVLFPIFYLLEKRLNLFLLHGSAINFKGKGIAIAGLAGVGKSTYAISLTIESGQNFKFLTDNFLLFDEDYIYPFPEYIRLHDDMLKIIGDVSKLGPPAERRFGRNHYILDSDFISCKVKIDTLFIPSLSNAVSVRQLTLDEAMDRLLMANDQVKEFHMYHHFGLAGYLDHPKKSIYRRRIEVLEAFLSKTRIFELCIRKMQRPYEVWEKVSENVF